MNSLRRHFVLLIALIAACLCSAAAQTVSLNGTITDPSGAVIPDATISLTNPDGHTIATVKSDSSGAYHIHNLKPGLYIVIAGAQGFATSESKAVNFAAGQSLIFNIKLQIAVAKQQVVVNTNLPTVSVSPTNNASAVIIKGSDLNALSNDPDELQQELNALAGPAAGPNGGQIYIDGFTGGQLPPKSAIREIRINRNPFSAEYDRLGYGRIEILTKPGTNQLHGQFFVFGNASQFNTGNPFVKNVPSYYSYMFNGTVSGRINKNASFFISAQRRQIEDAAIVTAFRLAGEVNGDFSNGVYNNSADYNTVNFNNSLLTPSTWTNVTPRIDLSLSSTNTLTIRYQYFNNSQQNQGVGQFSLSDQAYNTSSSENTLQLSDSQILGNNVINDTHFEFRRDSSTQTPASTTPQVQVSGLETFGGSASGLSNAHTNYYELRNNTAIVAGKHSLNVGAWLRVHRDAQTSNGGFNGTFTFGGNRCTSGQTGCTTTTAAQNYANTIYGLGTGQSWTQIHANGGGPSQLNLTYGNPKIEGSMADVALYYQDDWNFRPNLTASYGLRWESQSGIHDKSDWAPRFMLSWALGKPGKPSKTVLRAGYGFFYSRFGINQILQADRLNINPDSPLHEAVIQEPTCYSATSISAADIQSCQGAGSASSKTAVYQIAPDLHAPVDEQAAASIEQQVTKGSTVSVTYIYSLGQHQLITRNANAPQVPGYDSALPNIYQYYSEAVYKQNQILANFNARFSKGISFFGFYTASWANSDTNGVGSNPSDSANLKYDYGRAPFDVRNRLFFMGSFTAPWGISLNPFVVAQSGRPFNITLGQDVNGDSFFNDRPSYAQPGDTDTIDTQYGNFNLNPGANYTPIPTNLGNGPALFTFNLRVGKSFAFGPKVAHGGFNGGFFGHWHGRGLGPGGLNGGGGGHGPFAKKKPVHRRFNMTVDVHALNLFNDINYAPPTGVLGSPEFGKSNALAGQIFSSNSASRRIFASVVFAF